jgi:2-polyprenyl-3-methyl-5-hydroxy-6-metoxy-1,4-benzoquinol methylase
MTASDSGPAGREQIRAILADLQEEIRRHRLALGELGAVERPDPLSKVRQHVWVNPHLPIGWPVMPKGIIPKVIAYAQKITRRLLRWYINPLIEQQNAYNAAVAEALGPLQSQSEEHGQLLCTLNERMQRLQELDALGQRVQTLETRVDETQRTKEAEQQQQADERELVRLRLQRLEEWRRSGIQMGTPANTPVSAIPQQAPPVDYFLLGAQYRSEEQMRARLLDYDDLFSALAQAQRDSCGPAGPVLDIGCGRGDLVAHLQALGLKAYGIEIDRDAIQAAQGAGRDVRQGDALVHLESLPDDSLAAITLIQVIEHLEINEALRLFRVACHKLVPGGLIIAETINPSCLAALSNAFLLDPSHRTPFHPQLTRFLLEQAGLWKVQIRFLRPVPESARLDFLAAAESHPSVQPLVDRLNHDIDHLNQILFGPQDYAAIAYRPEE